MKTEILTSPSPELRQHMRDLRNDADNITKDLKNQVTAGLNEVKSEATSRLQEAKGAVTDLIDNVRSFASEHPLKAFGIGVACGFILATRRRR